jgi:hypothetical protein
MVPTRAYHFPCLCARPVLFVLHFQPALFHQQSYLYLSFPHFKFFDSMPTRAYYFLCLGAHPCANTCSLACSRRTTPTPWTTLSQMKSVIPMYTC